jgi:hypothetical protein
MTPEPQEQIEEQLFRPGKDEMNFAEFPIALLTDRVPKGQKSIKFQDEIFDQKRKRVITRRRIIEGSEEYGLPTATDDAVILALIQLTKQKSNLTQREVEFTRLELIRMLGWPNEGKSYDRIKLSLLRIANVTYNYDNAWWDPRQKTWTTKVFHIIDTVEINDSRASGGQNGLFPSRIYWGDVVFDSFQAGFLRNIDFQLCMRLEHPTALRMYRFLGKRFHVKTDWTFDLKELAYDHIGLGRNYEGGTQIARKLQPAIMELENVGFLEPLSEDERFIKKGREWSVRFLQKAPALTLVVPPLAADEQASLSPLIDELITRGVGKEKAQRIAERFEPATIKTKLEVFDWLVAKKDKRAAKSPAGFLVKSIEEDYPAPKDFISKAEQQQRLEARQARERLESAERSRKQQQDFLNRAKDQRDLAYWKGLSADEQAQLLQTIDALATPEQLESEIGPLKHMGQLLRKNAYIRALLDSQEQPAIKE